MLASPSLSSSTLTLPPKPTFLHSKSTFHGLRVACPNLSSSSLRAQPSSSSTVMMSKKDEDLKEIRTKSNEQINEEILQLKGELFMLRLRRSAREDFKPSDFGSLRKKKMANMAKRDFDILDNNGTKYLAWRVDARANLKAKGLENTILVDENSTPQEQAKAIVFLRHHLHDNLKSEYLFVEDPRELWDNLCQRFESLERIIGPRAQYDWMNLRFQDFISVSDYDSAMLRITSQLRLCGQPTTDAAMIEKTLSTMHADNAVLQEMYRERQYSRYCDLIAILRMAEANMKVMFHNHNKRPAGTVAPPETHAIKFGKPWRKFTRGNTFHKGKGKWRPKFRPLNPNYKGKKKFTPNKGKPNQNTKCFKCGITGHWAKECRTAKHLVDLYTASQKGRGNEVETNFVKETSPVPSLDVSDYLIDDIDNVCGPSA